MAHEPRNPRSYISERYAAKAARAADDGHHKRAAELYRAALLAIEELDAELGGPDAETQDRLAEAILASGQDTDASPGE